MARAPKVTWDRIGDLIAEGYGQGHGEAYKPWLRLARWNPSPVSTQHYGPVPPWRRPSHFFAHSEYLLAVLLAWLGADVREQFPAWPWAHPHPLYGLDAQHDAALPWSGGLLDLCEAAGIDPGDYPGTSIPYIWSLDIVATFRLAAPAPPRCVIVSCKPVESPEFAVGDPLSRKHEKLEIERRYAKSIGAAYYVGDKTLYPTDLLGQLDRLRTSSYPPPTPHAQSVLPTFLDHYGSDLQDDSPANWIRRLQLDYKVPKFHADYLIHHCIWHQHIDCDLSRPVDMQRLPRPGGRTLRNHIRDAILGDSP